MVNRKPSADPSKDVGRWKHVEHADPYHTWEKDLPGGGKAQVLFGDTGPRSPDEWWSHIEYDDGGGYEWSDRRLPSGDDEDAVIRETMMWMQNNQDWQPEGYGGGLGMGGAGGSGFF